MRIDGTARGSQVVLVVMMVCGTVIAAAGLVFCAAPVNWVALVLGVGVIGGAAALWKRAQRDADDPTGDARRGEIVLSESEVRLVGPAEDVHSPAARAFALAAQRMTYQDIPPEAAGTVTGSAADSGGLRPFTPAEAREDNTRIISEVISHRRTILHTIEGARGGCAPPTGALPAKIRIDTSSIEKSGNRIVDESELPEIESADPAEVEVPAKKT